MAVLKNACLRIDIAETGAELRSVRTQADGAEWLWQGDPAWWAGRSPLLFPVIGQSPNGKVTIAGKAYDMPPHGFARTSSFQIVAADDDAVSLVLAPNDSTQAIYPFDFRLNVTYRLDDDCLRCIATVENHDEREMPFQFGFHPGFAWPLPGAEGQAHYVELGHSTEPEVQRLDAAGLVQERLMPSPFDSGRLEISPTHFEAGAMIFPDGAGTRFTYSALAAQIEMNVTNLPTFALWQKLGAPFLCLEPWHGMPPFPSQGSAVKDRSGCSVLSPRTAATFGMDLSFRPRTSQAGGRSV